MARAGIPCEILISDVDEDVDGPAHHQVERLALRKARAARQKTSGAAVIIAADTLVSLDGWVLSKPADKADAFAMLNALQGRKHHVYTGVAIIKTGEKDEIHSFVESAHVHFRPLTAHDIEGYIATGEPFDKAGAYGAQGRGAVLISRIEGDFFTVMGLPVSRLCVKLAEMGINIWNIPRL
jgi:septum formation protein